MINTGNRIRSTWILIILSIIIITTAVSLWFLFSSRDTEQDKTYSGAKLVEQKIDHIFDWRIL